VRVARSCFPVSLGKRPATATNTSASSWDACCRVPQRGSMRSEKDAFLCRRAIVVRVYDQHTHTHRHTHSHITHIAGCRSVNLYCCAFLRLQSYHHHIRHIMSHHGILHIIIHYIYIERKRERKGGRARRVSESARAREREGRESREIPWSPYPHGISSWISCSWMQMVMTDAVMSAHRPPRSKRCTTVDLNV